MGISVVLGLGVLVKVEVEVVEIESMVVSVELGGSVVVVAVAVSSWVLLVSVMVRVRVPVTEPSSVVVVSGSDWVSVGSGKSIFAYPRDQARRILFCRKQKQREEEKVETARRATSGKWPRGPICIWGGAAV
jgi:hypothetical protein